MSTIDDGVIKFEVSDFIKISDLPSREWGPIESVRLPLYKWNLIGEYLPEKIGFGNISLKQDYLEYHQTGLPQFIITGTQTGGKKELDGADYTRVLDFDLNSNCLKMMGAIKASSESLTHGAIYLIHPDIKAVIHIHSKSIWKKMMQDGLPTTDPSIPYGTVDMAKAVQSLFPHQKEGMLAMGGHEDGVITFAESMQRCYELTSKLYLKYGN